MGDHRPRVREDRGPQRRRFAIGRAGGGAGLQLHNLYGACEQLFELVARAFENQIDGPTYHVDLLRRMKAEITGVRPSFLTEGVATTLNELRGFRHFFRHAYDSELHSERVTELAATALALRPELRDSMDRFIVRLQAG